MWKNRKCRYGQVGALALASVGCQLEASENDVSRFLEPVPEASAVAVTGPEQSAEASEGSATQSVMAEGDSEGNGQVAVYYAFTRKVRRDINLMTAAVLTGVWRIVHVRPTSVKNEEAVWGPWTDELSPATYRFRVSEVSGEPGQYDYALEGRPKDSTEEGDFEPVLWGTGYGKYRDEHGDGQFAIDMDLANELDPLANPDRGQLAIIHDLPQDVEDNLLAVPRRIQASLEQGEESIGVATETREDRTGTLVLEGHVDLEESKDTLLEDLSIASQWLSSGAGRSDVWIGGGDTPDPPGEVSAVECWGASFSRTYYSDSAESQPTEGESSACVFDQALEP